VSTPSLEDLEKQLLARVQRANALDEQLSSSFDKWSEAQSFSPSPQIADDRLSWELIVEISEPPLEEWSSLYGDAVHNLRSALDNLAWGLAIADGRTPNRPKKVAFPIVERSGQWKERSQCIAELPSSARTAIRNIQPFQRKGKDGIPSQDPLLLLRRLSNVDKHQIAVCPLFNPTTLQGSFSVEYRSEQEAFGDLPPKVTFYGEPFTKSYRILRQETKFPIVRVGGACKIEAEAVVIDGVRGRIGLTPSLAELVTYIPQVIAYVLGRSGVVLPSDVTDPE
jgi:hypothetical protein